MKKLDRDFYLRDACLVAHDLIGKVLVHNSHDGLTSGIITETEAYKGPEDKAAHSYKNKRTSRTEIMFHEGGLSYVYMIYGMYYCFNVTANFEGKPEAVLIRSLEPLEGIEIMIKRRRTKKRVNLCSGPGKLCESMGINKRHYGADLCCDELYILDDGRNDLDIMTSERINIDYAEECRNFKWRYYTKITPLPGD